MKYGCQFPVWNSMSEIQIPVWNSHCFLTFWRLKVPIICVKTLWDHIRWASRTEGPILLYDLPHLLQGKQLGPRNPERRSVSLHRPFLPPAWLRFCGFDKWSANTQPPFWRSVRPEVCTPSSISFAERSSRISRNVTKIWSGELYTITWLLCAFSLVVDRDLLKDTHTDGVKSASDHVSGLAFLFSCTKILQLNFHCIKQIDNIFTNK